MSKRSIMIKTSRVERESAIILLAVCKYLVESSFKNCRLMDSVIVIVCSLCEATSTLSQQNAVL